MPPSLLFDISNIDLTTVLYGPDEIRKFNPQRDKFEMLEGVIWVDATKGQSLAYKDVRDDEYWVEGHIPGRPLFPGVLQIELAAQISSFFSGKVLGWTGFLGFGGVDEVRFRGQVTPGSRLYVLMELQWAKHRRVCCKTQGIVNGNLVFEAVIIGVKL